MILKKWQRKFNNFRKLSSFLKIKTVLEKIPLRPLMIYRFFIFTLTDFSKENLNREFATLRFATLKDSSAIAQLQNNKENDESCIKKRFDNKDRCLLALHQDEIVGHMWISLQPIHIEERSRFKFTIPDDAIFLYDQYIKEAHRLKGIWIQFQCFLKNELEQAQRRRLISLIDDDNSNSLKTHLRFGYTTSSSIFVVNFLNHCILNKRFNLTKPLTLRDIK